MKKIFSTMVLLIALLAMTTGAAFAGSAIELVEVRNDDGQPKFIFRVTGEFSNEELENGFVTVGDQSYRLYCAQTAPTTVVCHTSNLAAGNDVVVGFGGIRSWVKVPEEAPEGGDVDFCEGLNAWPFYVVDGTFPAGTGFVQDGVGCFDAGFTPTVSFFYDFGYDPNGWGPWVQFNDGSIPFPGSGFPSLGPGLYQ